MTTNIRASMLPSYPDCARRAAAKQFRKEIEGAGFALRELNPSAGAALGTAVHAGAEYMFRQKLNGGIVRPTDATEVAVGKFTEETLPGAEWDDATPNLNTAVYQITRMVAVISDFARIVQPHSVELELRADAGDGFELTGHVDLLDHAMNVRDLKTGALERPYQSQLGGYSLLVKSNGERPSGVAIDWLPRVPKTRVQPPVETQTYQIDTCERAAWATIQMIKRDLKQFRETGDPWAFMANPMTMMCSPKYCPAHGTKFCDMHKQQKSIHP